MGSMGSMGSRAAGQAKESKPSPKRAAEDNSTGDGSYKKAKTQDDDGCDDELQGEEDDDGDEEEVSGERTKL